jgi:hypothetical protein
MMEVLVLGDESAKCDVCVAPESEEGGHGFGMSLVPRSSAHLNREIWGGKQVYSEEE